MITPKAMLLIESSLSSLIRSGKKINNLSLMVNRSSVISQLNEVNTRFGKLKVVPGEYIPKGYSYLIERPLSKGGISFKWVSKSPPAAVGERSQ
ncbi:hypothetical protein V1L65_22525 [Paenibacillus sp. IITD108]